MTEKSSKDDIAALSFEDALGELEAIVKTLESGSGKLEDSIAAYERGARLKEHCEKKLAEAKAKVEKIKMGPGGPEGVEPADLA
jgi:exodeoxyribonuclease VII small subunit